MKLVILYTTSSIIFINDVVSESQQRKLQYYNWNPNDASVQQDNECSVQSDSGSVYPILDGSNELGRIAYQTKIEGNRMTIGSVELCLSDKLADYEPSDDNIMTFTWSQVNADPILVVAEPADVPTFDISIPPTTVPINQNAMLSAQSEEPIEKKVWENPKLVAGAAAAVAGVGSAACILGKKVAPDGLQSVVNQMGDRVKDYFRAEPQHNPGDIGQTPNADEGFRLDKKINFKLKTDDKEKRPPLIRQSSCRKLIRMPLVRHRFCRNLVPEQKRRSSNTSQRIAPSDAYKKHEEQTSIPPPIMVLPTVPSRPQLEENTLYNYDSFNGICSLLEKNALYDDDEISEPQSDNDGSINVMADNISVRTEPNVPDFSHFLSIKCRQSPDNDDLSEEIDHDSDDASVKTEPNVPDMSYFLEGMGTKSQREENTIDSNDSDVDNKSIRNEEDSPNLAYFLHMGFLDPSLDDESECNVANHIV